MMSPPSKTVDPQAILRSRRPYRISNLNYLHLNINANMYIYVLLLSSIPCSRYILNISTQNEPGSLTDESLHEAYELEIRSENGKSVRFGELVAGKGEPITTIVIFK